MHCALAVGIYLAGHLIEYVFFKGDPSITLDYYTVLLCIHIILNRCATRIDEIS